MPPAALLIGGIAAIAGSQKDEKKTTTSTAYDHNVELKPPSALQQQAEAGLSKSYGELQGMVDAGPGQSDVTAGTNASRGFAEMLQQYSQQGGNLPTAQDMASSQGIAENLFSPQRLAMQNAFSDQSIQANRQAALLGRSTNDPILQAKLAQEQTRQSAMLQAHQGAFSQNFALQQPGQRLNFAGQRASILGGLATQAMSNRQSLAAMGQNILSNQQQFQLATARRHGTGSSTSTTESGGGVKGALNAAIGGFGAGMQMMTGDFKGMAGMGGGGEGMANGANDPGSYFGGSNPYSSGSGASFGGFGGGGAMKLMGMG